MIVLSTVTVVVSLANRQAMLRSLQSTVEPTAVIVGCLECRLYQDVKRSDTLVLVSRWRTRECVQDYSSSDLFRIVLSVVEMSETTPKIQFDTIAESSGLEFIESIR